MVEVDIQFLAGVAVTVFLALMFFGVVVLWDVALALRSVGDKIDKLEDNVDDDLKDIGYSLDSISNAPGAGGAQFHLSGGTISSEPTPNQRPTAETQPEDEHPSREEPRMHHQQSAHSETESAQGRSDDAPSESQSSEQSGSQGGESKSESETGRETGDGTETAADETPNDSDPNLDRDESDSESKPKSESESEHPRASINRGRFVTSPDRTAWYAIPLDRDAVANASPEIAGELEAGEPDAEPTDESEPEVIAAGPAFAGERHESESEVGDETEDPIGAGASGPEEPSAELDTDEASKFDDSTTETTATNPLTGEAGDAVDGGSSDGEIDSDSNAPAADRDGGPTESDDSDSDRNEQADDDIELSSRPESEPEPDSDVEFEFEADSESVTEVEVESKSDSELEPDSTSPDSSPDADFTDFDDAADADDATDSADADDTESFTDFEFSDLTGELDEDGAERTVDEAIDSMNDETPSLSLSSHGFEVTAEADDDGAVLVFEFDPDTVEITGSTERLLRYQMRSFAEQESTPDGDVTIEGNTIVVELPEADGDAVSRWGEAAVGIIDRTLYLSDNSN